MLLQKKEELWSPPAGVPHMIIVHTNSVASYTGEMVMGQGSAAQAKQIYSQLPKIVYKKIRSLFPAICLNGTEDYGFLPIIDPPVGIGIFQTKRHWGSVARLETIQRSAEMLAEYANQNLQLHIRMSFPTCGERRWGKMNTPSREEVEKLLYFLPNNVHMVDWSK